MSYHQIRWRWPPQRRKDLPYPVFKPWRWRTNIKKHYRVLDLEDVYDVDDFFKVEVTAAPFYEFMSPNEARRKKYQQQARARAERIVAEIDHYRWLAASRKRLERAKREFDFVFEPYRKALKQKYSWRWRYQFAEKRDALYWRVWQEMRRLRWVKKKQQPEVDPGTVEIITATVTNLKNLYGVQWVPLAREGKPYLRLGFPEQTVLHFIKEPRNDIGNRLDRYGLDWRVEDVDGTHWLLVIFPVPELMNWIKQKLPKL